MSFFQFKDVLLVEKVFCYPFEILFFIAETPVLPSPHYSVQNVSPQDINSPPPELNIPLMFSSPKLP